MSLDWSITDVKDWEQVAMREENHRAHQPVPAADRKTLESRFAQRRQIRQLR